MNTTDNKGLFSEVFRKKDYQYQLWVTKADFQLRLKTKSLIAKHTTGEDIISDIVTGVLCGTINWDQENVPNINTFMHHQIRGHISNIIKKELNKLTPALSKCEKVFPKYIDTSNLVSESLEEIIKQQDLNELREIILDHLKDDTIAYFVFEEIIKGSKNQDISESLGITMRDVVNAKRRIDTVLNKILLTRNDI